MKIIGNLCGLIGSSLSFLIMFGISVDLLLFDKGYDIKIKEAVDLYDIMFETTENYIFRTLALVSLALIVIAIFFFFVALIISLTKKTGKNAMGVLGMISMVVSSFILMLIVLFEESILGAKMAVDATVAGTIIFFISYCIVGAKLCFDN